jgi:hypothetical protein
MWTFSDGSHCQLVIYRNFFRPHDDFICRFIIYDQNLFIRASVAAKIHDNPISLTQYYEIKRKKDIQNKAGSYTVGRLENDVRVYAKKTSLGTAAKAAIMGFDECVAFSDNSIGANAKFVNHTMPSGFNHVNIGFVLDNQMTEIARYNRGNHRLFSRKEYTYLQERKNRQTDKPIIVTTPYMATKPLDVATITRHKKETIEMAVTAFKKAQDYADFIGEKSIKRIKNR